MSMIPPDKMINSPLLEMAFSKYLCSSKEFPYPTQTTIQKRLRDKYNIFVNVVLDKTTNPKFGYEIDRYKNGWEKQILSQYLYLSYESALEHGLIEAIDLITKYDLRKEKLKKLSKKL